MRPGYLQKNGVPYSGNAVLTEIVRNGVIAVPIMAVTMLMAVRPSASPRGSGSIRSGHLTGRSSSTPAAPWWGRPSFSLCGPTGCGGGDPITSDLYSDAEKHGVPADAVAASLGWMLDSFDVMLYAMVQEHERGLGGWHAEWQQLRTVLRLAIGNVRTEERHVKKAWDQIRKAVGQVGK